MNFYVRLSDDMEIRKSQSELLQQLAVKRGIIRFSPMGIADFERQYFSVLGDEYFLNTRSYIESENQPSFTFEQAYAELSKPTYKVGNIVWAIPNIAILGSKEKRLGRYVGYSGGTVDPYIVDYAEFGCAEYTRIFSTVVCLATPDEVAKAQKKEIIINGYKMEYRKDGLISFGCAHFIRNQFLNVEDFNFKVDHVSEVNRKIKSITLDSGVEITIEQIEEILEATK